MELRYKDLTYIRTALQVYEAQLSGLSEEDCDEDEFSEAQDDAQYARRLLAMISHEIGRLEASGPSLNPVRDPD